MQAEGLLLEQDTSSCYELIGQFIGCISDHLQDLTKQRYVYQDMHLNIQFLFSLRFLFVGIEKGLLFTLYFVANLLI